MVVRVRGPLETAEVSKQRMAPTVEPSPQMSKDVRWGLVGLLLLAALSIGIGVLVYFSFNDSYQDGFNYASHFIAGASQLRACDRDVMIFDAHNPNDDYSQWAAGCKAGAMVLNNTGAAGHDGALGRRPRLTY